MLTVYIKQQLVTGQWSLQMPLAELLHCNPKINLIYSIAEFFTTSKHNKNSIIHDCPKVYNEIKIPSSTAIVIMVHILAASCKCLKHRLRLFQFVKYKQQISQCYKIQLC